MTDFELIDKEVRDRTPLASAFVILSQKILQLKRVQFDPSDLDFDYGILVKLEKINFAAGKWTIGKDDMFCYIFLKQALSLKQKIFSESPGELFNTLTIINQHFDDRRFFSGLTEFLKEVYIVALQYQYVVYTPDYILFFTQHEKSTVDYQFWRFLDACSGLITYLKYPPEKMYLLFRAMYSFFDFESGGFDGNLMGLNQAIMRYSTLNAKRATDVASLCLENPDSSNRVLLAFLWAGILETDKDYIHQLKILCATPDYQSSVLAALSKVSHTAAQVKTVLEIIEMTNKTSINNQLSAAEIYVDYLIHVEKDDLLATEINGRFMELIKSNDPNVAAVCVNLLNRLKTPSRIHPFLTGLVTTGHFDKRLMGNIDLLLMLYDDAEMYFQFVLAFCQKNSIADLPLDHVTPFLRNKNMAAFDKVLVDYLIHDAGPVRFIAGRVLRAVSNHSATRRFQQDVTLLSDIDQVKLFVSVLNGLNEPKYVLSFILPVCLSNSRSVRHHALEMLKTYTEEYGNAVQELIETEWYPMAPEQSEIYNAVKNYTRDFWQALEKKGMIKELNPVYIQARQLETFNKSYDKHFSRNLTAHVEKRSVFHQIAQTVAINKGGGWQSGPSKDISKLFTVGASMTLPRSYFISPDDFEWERRADKLENWKNFTIDEQ